MKNKLITAFEKKVLSTEKKHPKFRAGDTVRVHYKIEEGTAKAGEAKKYRIQQYEGVCIRYKKGTVSSTFTVRKMGANNIGVERIFPIHSPNVDRIDVLAAGIVRRSRLFYLRDLTGKAARIKTRRFKPGEPTTTQTVKAEKAPAPAAAE